MYLRIYVYVVSVYMAAVCVVFECVGLCVYVCVVYVYVYVYMCVYKGHLPFCSVTLHIIPLKQGVLVRFSIDVKRYHDHRISDKEKHLIGEAYIFRGSVHYYHGATWWHAGRHGAGEVAGSPTSWLAGHRKWSETLGMA